MVYFSPQTHSLGNNHNNNLYRAISIVSWCSTIQYLSPNDINNKTKLYKSTAIKSEENYIIEAKLWFDWSGFEPLFCFTFPHPSGFQ